MKSPVSEVAGLQKPPVVCSLCLNQTHQENLCIWDHQIPIPENPTKPSRLEPPSSMKFLKSSKNMLNVVIIFQSHGAFWFFHIRSSNIKNSPWLQPLWRPTHLLFTLKGSICPGRGNHCTCSGPHVDVVSLLPWIPRNPSGWKLDFDVFDVLLLLA